MSEYNWILVKNIASLKWNIFIFTLKNDTDIDWKLSNHLFWIWGMPNSILYSILWKTCVNIASHSDLT